MKLLTTLLGLSAVSFAVHAQTSITYEGKEGPGHGKHIVLIAGDEEYRSEESLPMLGKLLSQRHGFKCTVLFSVLPDGTIDPAKGDSVEGIEALDSADLCILGLRFRHWPDDKMKHFDDYVKAGKPIIALRTSTHAFNNDKKSAFAKYAYNASADTGWAGGFGRQVLGETWVSHWGKHKSEATRGVFEAGAKDDPLFRGVDSIFGDTDVYEASPPADAKILVRGQVLKGMKPTDEPADYMKKGKSGEQPVNNPMQPVLWTRLVKSDAGKESRILCTTMGSATDLANEGLRRVVVNAAYLFTGLEVPASADVTIVGDYNPSFYGFKGNIPGLQVKDHALGAPPLKPVTFSPAK